MQRIRLHKHHDAQGAPAWTTNQDAIHAWATCQATRIAKSTLTKYRYEIERFARAWADPVWSLDRHDLWRYVEA